MRVYDGKYLSVTSILQLKHPFDSSSFKRWCLNYGFNEALVSSTSRVLGEKVSEYLDNYSKGLLDLTGPSVDMLEANLYSAVDSFLEKWELVSTEQVVYCDELHYAGRYDGIIREKGTRNILLVDWKTYGAWNGKPYKRVSGKVKSAKEQLTLYAYAMDWKGGLGVVIFKNDGSWEIEKVVFEKGILEWVKSHQKEILNLIAEENEKVSKKV